MEPLNNPFKQAMLQALSHLEKDDLGTFDQEGNLTSKQADGAITLAGAENEAAFKTFNPSNNKWDKSHGVSEATLDFFDILDGKKDGNIHLTEARTSLLTQTSKEILGKYLKELGANAKEMSTFLSSETAEDLGQDEKVSLVKMTVRFQQMVKVVNFLADVELEKEVSRDPELICTNSPNMLACLHANNPSQQTNDFLLNSLQKLLAIS